MRLLAHQLRAEQLIFWRSREAAVFIFVFPIMLFLLLGFVYTGEIDGFPAADALLVGLLGYGCANTAFAGLAITLVVRRELGVLKRIRSTPLPSPIYLAAVLGSTLIVFALQALLLELLGTALFDTRAPEAAVSLVLALLLGAAAFAGIGLAVASLIRSAEGSSAVVNLILLPMAFLSGSFSSTEDFPDALQALAAVLPLTYLIDLVEGVSLHGRALWEEPRDVAVLALWGLAGLTLAARRFRWEPHGC